MIALLIFLIFSGALLLLHFAVAVWYKIHTKTKKSIFYIMDRIL